MRAKLQADLARLQKQYEKKMATSAIVPPAIVQDALRNIAKKMDRIEEQLKALPVEVL